MAVVLTSGTARVSALYWAPIAQFLQASPAEILGRLGAAGGRDVEAEQRQAWESEVDILRQCLAGLDGALFLEFAVPRLGSRVDAVVVAGPAVFPIEFKVGQTSYTVDDHNQVWDYALDLKNFHKASHDAPILPVLVATDARSSDITWAPAHADNVFPPIHCNAEGLVTVLRSGLTLASGSRLDGIEWGRAAYEPTPTIIEAARALYASHSVEAITRHDAGARNLSATSRGVEEVIEEARQRREKAIVFVTGVPGAGKTLVGLNVATKRRDSGEARAVYLSGNGPLVAVLQEALTRDELARHPGVRKGTIKQRVKPFIQNVHHFRDEGLRDEIAAPYDHVVIFDEAQRAWDRRKTADFMKRRKKRPGFAMSEPEFLISYLDRHESWGVVICLVGEGQEIHQGEAGISEWLRAIQMRFPHWKVFISPDLREVDQEASAVLDTLSGSVKVVPDERLHLATSMRSFRSEKVSAFVGALLDVDLDTARAHLSEVVTRYPIAVTRDLDNAKRWVRRHARGNERFGLVASSEAQRLKPHAIDIRVKVDPVHWFLNDRDDTRSSYYLEDAATEFQVQGLELDWICVTWDADLRLRHRRWNHHSFRGTSWTNIKNRNRQRYLLNTYRVLLTRARQGMVVFVPPGDAADATRLPNFYDETFEYLSALGIPQA